jgi:hypothetical protein
MLKKQEDNQRRCHVTRVRLDPSQVLPSVAHPSLRKEKTREPSQFSRSLGW